MHYARKREQRIAATDRVGPQERLNKVQLPEQ
jgi:hypothetical protein